MIKNRHKIYFLTFLSAFFSLSSGNSTFSKPSGSLAKFSIIFSNSSFFLNVIAIRIPHF
ncbi:hypothetical protein D3846_00615 [Streptococcus mutans]|uniref:Uncharacterized protein n=1 Tax=Streptococcus mutans serotype c (strain ATCC 700610 / UA159) TaxID=210007 RepID=Q8DUY2_STRMU|nr:hypothetical protein SMU_748 [Streptococcus mutans UA159]AYO47948.1 hypothetical protein EBA30_05415 [Streptococcus mutans]RKV75174.1 MAG: hypothetical protein D8H99_56260 [Streptococcus sp.]NLQ29629.1 hypothetical protein [Streptococcus mutans]NLQ31611.1 hypothetical protein [Streptococcus mutans]